jgi:hypothetical protein
LNGVAFADATTGLAVGYPETISRTNDGGQFWTLGRLLGHHHCDRRLDLSNAAQGLRPRGKAARLNREWVRNFIGGFMLADDAWDQNL